MKINQNRKNHINILDDLRGIAILTVAFYHYYFVYFIKNPTDNTFITYFSNFTNYINLGSLGVSLFFLVSGFVIPMSLKGANDLTTIKYFFIRRFFRLFPTYWFSIIIIVTISYLFIDTNKYNLEQIIINFTMLHDFFHIKSIDGVFWTLLIELKFYILSALFFYFGLLNRIFYIVATFFLISLISLLLGYIYSKGFGNHIFSHLMLMYLGSAFYFNYIGTLLKNHLNTLIIVVIFYFLINHFFLTNSIYGDIIGKSISTIIAIGIFYYSIRFNNSFSRITTFYGNVSYSFYLIHQVLGYALINNLFNNLFSQIITFIVFTFCSYFIYILIEKPTNKFGHLILNRNKH